MKPELENKICERFSFYRTNLPITESLLCFGFECGNGWFDLLWELSEKLEVLYQEYLKTKPVEDLAKSLLLDDRQEFNVVQVKEKFGGLRFYTDWATDEMQNIINEYEDKSYTICENCGKPGSQSKSGWIKTLCKNCKEEKK